MLTKGSTGSAWHDVIHHCLRSSVATKVEVELLHRRVHARGPGVLDRSPPFPLPGPLSMWPLSPFLLSGSFPFPFPAFIAFGCSVALALSLTTSLSLSSGRWIRCANVTWVIEHSAGVANSSTFTPTRSRARGGRGCRNIHFTIFIDCSATAEP